MQFIHSGVIKIEGDKATAKWLVHEAGKGPGELYYHNYAMYIDALQKINSVWHFVERDYHFMWLDTGAFPGDSFALPFK